jgi:hypothetical protein
MALSVLTDSEKRAFSEVYGTTKTKIKLAIVESGLPELTAQIKAEVDALRKEQKARHRVDGWKFIRNLAAKVVGDIDNLSK